MKLNSKNLTAVQIAVSPQPMTKASLAARSAGRGDLVSLNPQPLPPKEVFGQDQFETTNATKGPVDLGQRSAAEGSMIELQSVVSQRSTALQLATNLTNSLDQSMKDVLKNMEGGGGGSSGGNPDDP